MATRMNMMKLLLEVRGFAELTHKRLPSRPLGPLLLQFNFRRARFTRPQKWTLPISIKDPPEIPSPVAIKYLGTVAAHSPGP